MHLPITIFVEKNTERLQYTLEVIFKNILQIPFCLTENSIDFENTEAAKINYSEITFASKAVNILPANLVFGNTINVIDTPVTNTQGQTVLFPVEKTNYFSFDIFSAAFYMISRYEEYLPFTADEYGRFTEKQSLSGRYGFTHQPIVNIWCQMLWNELCKNFENCKPILPKSDLLFTYDIDVAYAYRGRSFQKQLLSLGKDLWQLNVASILKKLHAGFGMFYDPSDTYSLIEENPVDKLFFFLLANKKSPYDHNLHPHTLQMQNLVKKISVGETVGIHPSYFSIENSTLLQTEKNRLEQMVNNKIIHSRQHYLRLQLPDTYCQLATAGIQHDYSLAYAEKPGFRAGTSSSYPFFDLKKNKITELTIHPTCIMDSTFRDSLKISAHQSLPVYLQLLDAVEKYGGRFICIWHNDMLAKRQPNHPLNFRAIYLALTQQILSKGIGR